MPSFKLNGVNEKKNDLREQRRETFMNVFKQVHSLMNCICQDKTVLFGELPCINYYHSIHERVRKAYNLMHSVPFLAVFFLYCLICFSALFDLAKISVCVYKHNII